MDKYNKLARMLHWAMSVLLIGTLIGGLYMTSLEDNNSIKYQIYDIHKSFGMILLFLFVIRIINRWKSYIPELPKEIPHYQSILAKSIHHILYVFMLIIPVTGYLMSVASGHTVKIFGVIIPSLVEKNSLLASNMHFIHINVWYLLLVVLFLHIFGTLKHYFYDKVNLFRRMW